MALHLTGAPDGPELVDLPWHLPLRRWPGRWLVGLPRGISRHVVRFVSVHEVVYAVKEIGAFTAQREYDALRRLERRGIPCVQAVAIVDGRSSPEGGPLEPALVTRHLEFSLPYRALFASTLRPETAVRLLDALAVLLVRLHLAGFYWGDCSLSNTLFRRDAGSFAAYLVDAETTECHEPALSDGQRRYDLSMARTNIIGELMDLQAGGLLDEGVEPLEVGDVIVSRYEALWTALTQPEVFGAGERHRVEARIRRLNDLGFDVAELGVTTDPSGQETRIQPKVVDAGHHARRLLRLTGLDVEENQARRLLNDLDAFRSADAQAREGESEQISAHRWLTAVFHPVVESVPRELCGKLEAAEIFHEVLEHRWFLSEQAGRDVGTAEAAASYVETVLRHKPDEKAVLAPAEPSERPLGYGVATSSYQIEGAVDQDGRGPSIWDTFCTVPGAIADGTDGRTACNSYVRLDEDLALIEALGVTAYRFSVSWCRVQPTGSGRVEPRGLDYYERLVDGLLSIGVRPFPTLYHWDLPQPLEDAGGWPLRDVALRFADYAGIVSERLGAQIGTWTTVNEPWCSAFLGYAAGVHAPGRRDPDAAFAAAHHLLLAHAMGREAVRAQVPEAQVGLALNLAPVHLDGGDPLAAAVVDATQNALWLDPLADGRYPELLMERAPVLRSADVVRPGDLEAVRGSADWLGVNYYTPMRVGPVGSAAAAAGQTTAAYPYAPPFAFAPHSPRTEMGWEIDASGMTDVLLSAASRLPGTPLRVTENGAAFADAGPDPVDDQDRISYLREHLAAVELARSAGAPVMDYFVWTLLDNFEWAEGYSKAFGLVAVDAVTQARRPKASYRWFAGIARGPLP